jgi:hypothetical protein
VRRYAKSWRKARGAMAAQAYIPLSFAPGEAYLRDRVFAGSELNSRSRLRSFLRAIRVDRDLQHLLNPTKHSSPGDRPSF